MTDMSSYDSDLRKKLAAILARQAVGDETPQPPSTSPPPSTQAKPSAFGKPDSASSPTQPATSSAQTTGPGTKPSLLGSQAQPKSPQTPPVTPPPQTSGAKPSLVGGPSQPKSPLTPPVTPPTQTSGAKPSLVGSQARTSPSQTPPVPSTGRPPNPTARATVPPSQVQPALPETPPVTSTTRTPSPTARPIVPPSQAQPKPPQTSPVPSATKPGSASKRGLAGNLRKQFDDDSQRSNLVAETEKWLAAEVKKNSAIVRQVTTAEVLEILTEIDADTLEIQYPAQLRNAVLTRFRNRDTADAKIRAEQAEAVRLLNKVGDVFRQDTRPPDEIATAGEFNRRNLQSITTARDWARTFFCDPTTPADTRMTTWVTNFPQGWPITSSGPESEGAGVSKDWCYGIAMPAGLQERPITQAVLGQAPDRRNQDCTTTLWLDQPTLAQATIIAVGQGHGNGEVAWLTPVPVAWIRSYVYGKQAWKPYPGDLGAQSKADHERQISGRK